MKNGKGEFDYANGDKFEGSWVNDSPNGVGMNFWEVVGKHTSANGDVYEGEWKDGKKEGKGVMLYANGEKYNGQWKDDKKSGVGKSGECLGRSVRVSQWGQVRRCVERQHERRKR
eukprot:TRINITY_DN4253_c0_g6_i1.p1 TRINITY_DN4253_c0_g6~~TRINITY_DN4253_c0_g6_i1.p1  ORF type:complete len:115 (+),score=11.47 TRINITY_DN4253_c0_g6_i1:277-621(+)